MIDGVAWDLQGATQGGEEHAEGEHPGEQPFLVDPERRHHVAVLRRRPGQDAEPRAVEQQPKRAQHGGAENDQQQVVAR